uniref:Uncharacterized protein n=1 Tax=Oryza sativa subsp. japonica TaxID=39947 RepID=Q6Z640_ORYSJ|nr:hypothetical protein [Oryza sativa Japonica Group]
MESSGAADGKRKKEEENAGMVYMGSGGTDEAGRRPDFSPTWGSGEREFGGGGLKPNPALAGLARAGEEGEAGGEPATWVWGGAQMRSGGGGAPAVGATAPTARGGRRPTGGPHLSAPEGEREGGRTSGRGEAGRRGKEWADGPRKGKRRKKKREKGKRIFPGI